MFNLFIGRIKAEKIPDLISSYIDKFILSLVEVNLKKFNLNENQFASIGLGSYGNNEMHFKSDIDLLFVFSNKTDEMIAEKFSLNLLSDIRDRLKLLDYFQVDSRLRPEGSISKLAWSIDEIKKYINTRMRVWEFQSYTKMRLITGSKFIYDELTNSLNQRLKNLDEKFIAVEIKKNRLNIKSQKISSLSSSLDIKNSNGGLMDLQFFIHHKILRHNFKEQTIGRNFVDALSLLSKKDETLKKYKTTLSKNYQKLFKLILILQVLTGKRGFVLEKNFDSKFVKKYLKIPERINGFEYFEQILKENSFILKKLNPEIFE
jgi:glutamate-ammonia-ligase adenylyltransferase